MENKYIYFRSAEKDDMQNLYNWRNDPDTRRASFNTDEITLEKHIEWFNNSLTNKNRNIFIMMNEKGKSIGQIRFDREDNIEEIDITIAPDYRNQGYGVQALREGCKMYFNDFDVDYVIAKVKKDNIASLMAFEKAGFKRHEEHEDHIELRCTKDEK